MRKFIVSAIGILLISFAASANASIIGFYNITGNNVGDAAIGEAQLFVDVTDEGDGRAHFTFMNLGPEASSITDVFFDDGTLLRIAEIIDADEGGGDPGVDFSQDAKPGELPGANNAVPEFETTAGFSADSDPATQTNGVNPGETLAVIFFLQGSQTFATVEDELATGLLRIGIHVQGFASGGSESFVNNPLAATAPPGTSLPEPTSIAVWSLMVLCCSVYVTARHRQTNHN